VTERVGTLLNAPPKPHPVTVLAPAPIVYDPRGGLRNRAKGGPHLRHQQNNLKRIRHGLYIAFERADRALRLMLVPGAKAKVARRYSGDAVSYFHWRLILTAALR